MSYISYITTAGPSSPVTRRYTLAPKAQELRRRRSCTHAICLIVIHVKDLFFSYGQADFSLRIAELNINDGESVAVTGSSGSGKTTLLNLIAGIALPASGRIETNGVDIASLSESDRRKFRISAIGLVFQEFELLEYLTVLDNILLPFRVSGALPLTPDVRDRALALADEVEIADKLARYPDQLSQGERQRAAVCRALITRPPLLLADEPTGNLDPANTDRVLDILFDYANREVATLVTVTHDHDLIDRFSTVIDFKQFHASGTAEQPAEAVPPT